MVAQETAQTDIVVDAELLEQLGFAQVEAEQYSLFAIKGINGSDINAVEGFSDALHIACNQHCARQFALRDELDVGTNGAERLRHGRLGVVDYQKRVFVGGLSHLPDDGELGQFLHILTVDDGHIEKVFQEKEQRWNQ